MQNVVQRFRSIGNFESLGGLLVPVASGGSGTASLLRSNTSHTSGKYYFEMTFLSAASLSNVGVGVDNGVEALTSPGGVSGSVLWLGTGAVNYNGSQSVFTVSSFAVDDVLGVAVDITDSLIWFRDNAGNWNASGTANPATGAGGISIPGVTGGNVYAFAQLTATSNSVSANFGGPFVNAAPSGFGTF